MNNLLTDSFEIPRRDSSRDVGDLEMGMHQPDASDNLQAFYNKVDGIDSLIAKLTSLLTKLQVGKMAFSSVFRRVNIKELISSVPVYTSSTEASGGIGLVLRRWATKKTAGSTKNGRDSNPKYLGVKKFGGEKVEPGNIIVRQRGTRFHPGNYVGMGKDHTLFSLKEGHVRFERNKLTGRKWIHVEPAAGHALHPVYAAADGAADMELL